MATRPKRQRSITAFAKLDAAGNLVRWARPASRKEYHIFLSTGESVCGQCNLQGEPSVAVTTLDKMSRHDCGACKRLTFPERFKERKKKSKPETVKG